MVYSTERTTVASVCNAVNAANVVLHITKCSTGIITNSPGHRLICLACNFLRDHPELTGVEKAF